MSSSANRHVLICPTSHSCYGKPLSTGVPDCMSSLALQLLSPEEAVVQLEEAQCALPSTVGCTLRALVPRLRHAHRTVSEAALTLLQIHPHETLPYLPDLLSSSVEDTTDALEILSTLLQSDRTLLVPIIATLPQLPLSPQNVIHARATLAFALDVVHQHDLPAVVHALLHTPASAASAGWAGRCVRTGLARATLDASSTPVLAHVLSGALRTNSRVSRALRSQAGNPFLWPDILIWTLALDPTLPSPEPARQARASIHAAVTSALLAHPHALHSAARQAAPALGEAPSAVKLLALTAVASCAPHVAHVSGVVHFVTALVGACPPAAAPIAELLAARSDSLSQIVLRALATLGFQVPPFSPAATLSTRCSADDHAPVFLKIRKRLLFGQDVDIRHALLVANTICTHADLPVVRELLALLHETVSFSLSDGAAVTTLGIVANALVAGVVDVAFFSAVLKDRVLTQCPPGCFEENVGNDARAVGIRDALAVKIDVALLWNQPPSAVVSVVSAAVLCHAVRRNILSVDSLSFHVLNVVVLVPMVCVTLYQAVDDLRETARTSDWNSVLKSFSEASKDDAATELPEELLNLDSHDLLRAVTTFSTGIAIIIGLLNISCKSLERCKRVIDRRAFTNDDRYEKSDHRATWALLERLTELHRMMDALSLAYELLLQKGGHGRTNRVRQSLSNVNRKKKPTSREPCFDRVALTRAEGIMSTVRNAVFPGKRTNSVSGQCDAGLENFPTLRLETIISALSAAPDESEMLTREVMAYVERNHELVQVDWLLLNLLLRLIFELMIPSPKVSKANGDDPNRDENETASERVNLACSNQTVAQADKMSQSELECYFETIQCQFRKCNDIFYYEDDILDEEDKEADDESDACNVKWAPSALPSSLDGMEYIDGAISSLVNKDPSKFHASSVLHSPTFAALLLDRAATYVALSRNARLKSASNSHSTELVTVSGIALRIFVYVLREIPTFAIPISAMVSDPDSTDANETDAALTFVKKVNDNILTQLGTAFKQDKRLVRCDDKLIEGFQRVFHILEWIRITTPDSIVAVIAVEAHMTLAELGLIPSSCARQSVFNSLCTIYEYDQGVLWDHVGKHLVIQDSFQQWLLRRRGRISLQDACEINDVANMFPERPPWAELKTSSRKIPSIESYRLNMFFAGMNLNCSLLEACGWVRELCLIVSGGGCSARSLGERNHDKGDASMSYAEHRIMCDSLVDMIGFREIILSFLQLTLAGLEAFSITESLRFSRAHVEDESPLPGLAACIRLVCGIQELYGNNHEALVASMQASDKPIDLNVDEGLESEVVRAYISALHLSQRRLEELLQWYTNESMEVRDLNDQSVLCLKHIVGGLACAVSSCVSLVKIVRKTDNRIGDGSAEGIERKSPGYNKNKRRRIGEAKFEKNDEMSRGRRLLPKLADVCEQVRRGGAKLAKSLGIPGSTNLETLAAVAVSNDKSLYFGVGLVAMRKAEENNSDAQCHDEEDVDCESESNESEEVEDIQGFHARGANGDGEDVAPISVQLRRGNTNGTLG